MLAEAVKEAYPDATRVAVDLQTIRFSDNRGRRYTYLTPRLAQVALVKFDQGSQTITPFSVKLRNGVATMRTPRGPVSAAKHRDANAKRRAKRAAERAGEGGRPSVRAGTNKRLKQESGRDETSLRPTGGEPPPRSPVLADPPIPGGRRRTFGLRALDL
jgi:hypothetical protein